MARPVIAVHGNCQAEAIAYLLLRTPAVAERYDVLLFSNNDGYWREEELPEGLGRAVVSFEQRDSKRAEQPGDLTRHALPPTCKIVGFPAVRGFVFWPFRGRDPRNVPEPGHQHGRYPSGDRLAFEVSELDLGDRAYEEYMRRSVEAMPDLQRFLRFSFLMQCRMDERADFVMRDIVYDNLTAKYQFWTLGHLSAELVRELFRRLLHRAATELRLTANDIETYAQSAPEFEGQGGLQAPIHPLVIERLGLRFVSPTSTYRCGDYRWTFEEYMRRYIAFDRSW